MPRYDSANYCSRPNSFLRAGTRSSQDKQTNCPTALKRLFLTDHKQRGHRQNLLVKDRTAKLTNSGFLHKVRNEGSGRAVNHIPSRYVQHHFHGQLERKKQIKLASKKISQIFLKFFWNFFEIFLKLFWNYFEIFLKFFKNLYFYSEVEVCWGMRCATPEFLAGNLKARTNDIKMWEPDGNGLSR
jgi:hypothetical protein